MVLMILNHGYWKIGDTGVDVVSDEQSATTIEQSHSHTMGSPSYCAIWLGFIGGKRKKKRER